MAVTSHDPPVPISRRSRQRPRFGSMRGLYWRVFAVNAVVLVCAFLLLALTPVTISSTITAEQLLILLAGLSVMLAANAVLLRLSLSPLRELIGLMRRVDLLQPGSRLPASGSREVAEVIDVFNATLGRLEDERRSSMGRVLNAQEAERRRIAQELHDQIGQNLTAVLLDAERLGELLDGEQAEILDDMAELAKEILDEARRISYELRPAALDDLGLASAIEALCTGTARRAGIEISHSVDVLLPALDRDVELTIFRITQEALTNAVRHASCNHVTVRLAADQDAVVLLVADDGVGIADTHAGGGIRGMRERAHAIGGRLQITVPPAGGTQVSLRVPTSR